jgi:cytochrome P450
VVGHLDLAPLRARFRFERARKALDRVIYRLIEEHRASGVDRGDLLSMLRRRRTTGMG